MRVKRKADLLAERLSRQVGTDQADTPGPGSDEAGLEPLQLLARRLAAVQPAQLSPEAQVTGLVRVRETLHERREARSQRRRLVWRVARTALAVFLALLLTATGTVWAAEGSLPGQTLYSLKRQVETARLALTWRPSSRSLLLMSYADRRLTEVQAVCPNGDCPAGLLSDLETDVQAATTSIAQLPPGERTVPLERMIRLTGRTEEVLLGILERAPVELRDSLEMLLEHIRNHRRWADSALHQEHPGPTSTPTPAPTATATWTPYIPSTEEVEPDHRPVPPTAEPEPTHRPRRTPTLPPSPLPTELPTPTSTPEPTSTQPRLPPPTHTPEPTPTHPRLPRVTPTPMPTDTPLPAPTGTPYPYPWP